MAAITPVDALVELVPFLLSHRGSAGRDDLRAADLIADPTRLADVVAGSADSRGAADPVVRASLWWQGYAYRTAGTTLAAWVLGGAAPDPSAESGSGVRVADGRPAGLVIGPRAAEVTDRDELVRRLFAGHLDPLADALRAHHRIGRRLLWGNAASSIASCLGGLAAADGAPAGLGARIDEVTAALPHDIAALGTWLDPHRTYRRATCCLWWKTTAAAGALCSNCSLR